MRILVTVVLHVLVVVFGLQYPNHALQIGKEQTQELIDFREVLHVLEALRVLTIAATADKLERLPPILKLEGSAKRDEYELQRVLALAE